MKFKTLYILIFVIFIASTTEVYAQFGGGGNRGLYYRDADGDGLGDPNISTNLIPLDNSYVDNAKDCDDTNPNIGLGDIWYIDSDGDGFGETTSFQSACSQPAGYVNNNLDQCPGQYGTNNGCPGQTGPSSDQNYVHTIAYQKAFSMGQETLPTVQDEDKIESIAYFDGLGRGMQNVAIRAGGDNQDIVTHIEYDLIGRQAKEYLPYAALTNEGMYRATASADTYDFYATPKYETTTNPYSEKNFEASPLNRVVEQGAPGNLWKVNINSNFSHSIKLGYNTNKHNNVANQKIRLYTVSLSADYTPTLLSSGYYLDYTLTKTTTKDENWKPSEGRNRTTEEYKDKLGRVVLKRAYNNNQPHDTYYVYDKYGNLTYVLPPKAEATASAPTSTKLTELCYQYKYDTRNRLIEKKIPGKGWEYIVYDQLDRPIMTQDANLKSQYKWLFTKYDAFGRVAFTGITNTSASRVALQGYANNTSTSWVTKTTGTINLGGTSINYTNTAYPSTVSEILTVNYYDNYTFNRAGAGTTASAYNTSSLGTVKGLATGTRVKVLGTGSWITTVTYYDQKARPFYTYSKNDYLSTTDIVKSKLDYFTGRILETTTLHTKSGQATITTVDAFDYDAMNRIKQQTQYINGQVVKTELIAENTYDELGQLVHKGVGNLASDVTNRLQEIDYTYNVRGWLTQINDPDALGTNLFGFKINYYQGANPLYNGNIASTQWKTQSVNPNPPNNPVSTQYSYTYDHLNRLISATDNTGHYNLTSVAYDKNGNITALNRKGNIVQNPTQASDFGVMDNLKYYYQSNSNKLLKVRDLSYKPYGFKDGTNSGNDYTYDQNGNMLRDYNKGITSNITYNYFNLPTEIKFNNSNSKKINYTYDATGIKLRKVVNDNGSITTTDYAGNYVYENNVLQFFNTAEGYVTKSGNNFKYVYNYVDHLGNVRLSYSDSDGNGTVSQSEIIEESNYYPFGLKHKGYNSNISSNGNSVAQRFKFGGKEYDESLGLNTYDFGARNYNPDLGRWMNLDPLSEQYYDLSSYAYVANSPLVFTDPDGQEIVFGFQKDKDGSRKGEQAVKDNINSGLGGGDFAQIDKNGNLSINITDKQRANLTKGQKAFLGVLEEGINATDADGNSVDVNIAVVEGSETIRGGSYRSEVIDIADINAFGNGEAVNQNSVLAHEIKEQFVKQTDDNATRADAHSAGEKAEESITGFKREPDSPMRNKVVEKVTKRERIGTRTYSRVSGTLDFNYSRGSKKVKATIEIVRGNYTKVTRSKQ